MNLLKKIEALFNTEIPAVEAKFADVKSKDGSVLRITEEVIVGAKVEVINEDGTLSAPTSPEIILEDGTVVTVDQDGIITDIKAPDAEAETAEDEVEGEMESEVALEEAATEDEPAKEENTDSKRIDAIEAKIEELISTVNSLIEALQGKEAEMAAVQKENDELSKKASAPAANFKKFDKSEIKIKIEGAPEKNDMLSRVLKRKTQ